MTTAKEQTGALPPIESLDQLTAHLASGCKPKGQWRIGTEHEKFVFCRTSLKPVPYEGETGIRAILEKLGEETGWEIIAENNLPIGLKGEGASVSLEPGGQFELSGAPLENIHQTCDEVHRHLDAVKAVCDPLGVAFLGMGHTPTWTRAEIPQMPKSRYTIMRNYMPKVGSLGLDMMHRTCTVQVNLDFASEADMVKKFRTSLALQPIATALFANSGLVEGKDSGYASWRAHIWTDTDADRTGLLNFVFEDGFGFERYRDYMLDVPMYFLRRNNKFIDAAGMSFRDLIKGKLPAAPGELPTMEDWEDHLSTAFPEVRLKTFLEMRGADGGPWARICALPAFWVGLLYEQDALDAAWDVAKDWTTEMRETLRDDAARFGFNAKIGSRTVQDVALEVLEISRAGLKKRARMGNLKEDETTYLDPLVKIAKSGVTMGEFTVKHFLEDLGGDAKKLYEGCKY
ncbi:glutamate--cysteine ligase [Hyphococcus sp.]|uniref:glutamate--cysteine ligase n=1 Tax=Hyphococcus sp. TaxID=2038636 RepID=UPI00207ED1F1|nr:MAG: glutamate--cysteine ligase [Marinicaulis sp.]